MHRPRLPFLSIIYLLIWDSLVQDGGEVSVMPGAGWTNAPMNNCQAQTESDQFILNMRDERPLFGWDMRSSLMLLVPHFSSKILCHLVVTRKSVSDFSVTLRNFRDESCQSCQSCKMRKIKTKLKCVCRFETGYSYCITFPFLEFVSYKISYVQQWI